MFLWWSSYQCHCVYLRVITLSSLLWCSLRSPRQNNVRFVFIAISFVRSCISWFICFLYVSTYTGIPTSFPYQMMFIQFKSYTTGATNRTGTAYPYGTNEFTTVFSWVRFIQSLVIQPQVSIIFKRQLKKVDEHHGYNTWSSQLNFHTLKECTLHILSLMLLKIGMRFPITNTNLLLSIKTPNILSRIIKWIAYIWFHIVWFDWFYNKERKKDNITNE